jgi:hypothetical protein
MDETGNNTVDVFTFANSMNDFCSDGAWAQFKETNRKNSLEGSRPGYQLLCASFQRQILIRAG